MSKLTNLQSSMIPFSLNKVLEQSKLPEHDLTHHTPINTGTEEDEIMNILVDKVMQRNTPKVKSAAESGTGRVQGSNYFNDRLLKFKLQKVK